MAHGIRGKLAGLVLTSLGVACIVTVAVSVWLDAGRQARLEQDRLQASAAVMASMAGEAVAAGDRPAAFEVIRAVSGLSGVRYGRLETADGALLVETGGGVRLIGDAEVEAGDHVGLFDLLSTRTLTATVPVQHEGQTVGRLVVFSDLPGLHGRFLGAMLATLAGALVAAVCGLIVAGRMGDRIARPIVALAGQMAQVRAGHDYSPPAPVRAQGEVAELASGFADLMAAIRVRDGEIRTHIEGLEEKVAERTADLQAAKLAAEEANAAKSDFVAAMSHEIRTPLNGILALAELLAGADLPGRQRRHAEIIAKSGKSLLAIINDILDFAKVEAGKLEMEAVEVDLAEAAEDVASLFAERARAKDLDLAVYVDPATPRVLGDPIRLRQILSNLLNNALKFTETGGALITVEPDPQADGSILLSVRDSGVGIPADKLPTLFEAFSQADQSTTRKYGGTGLGLTICDRFVKAMGGDWRLSSQVGQGSIFAVSLPLPAVETPETPRLAELKVDLDGLTGPTRAALRRYAQSVGAGLATGGLRLVAPSSPSEDRANSVVVAASEPEADGLIARGLAVAALIQPVRRAELLAVFEAAAAGRSLRQDAAAARRRATHPRFAGLRVLVVDDSDVNLEVALEALAHLGLTADTAVNGRLGVEAAASRAYDLILMDGSMPEMDGFEAARQIRQNEAQLEGEGAHRSVINALTAHVVGSGAEAWKSAGMDGVLHKPFSLSDLAALILAAFPDHVVDAPPATSQSVDAAPAPTAEAPSHDGLFDSAVREELAELGPGFIARLETVWRDQTPATLQALAEALQAGDTASAGAAAHRLKSMSLTIGARAVSDAATDIEAAAHLGHAEPVQLARLLQAVDQTRAALTPAQAA